MEIEQLEIRDFLAQCPPLNKLDDKVVNEITFSLEITYKRRDTEILKSGEKNDWLYLIRTGAIEVTDSKGNIYGHFGERHWFGHRCLVYDGVVQRPVKAIEDCLLYLIPGETFRSLVSEHEVIRQYFSDNKTERLKNAIQALRAPENNTLISTPIYDLMHKEPLLLDHATTIQTAAQRITEKAVTSALITYEEEIQGIVTVTAFCTKVVALRLNLQEKISTIMTPSPLTISSRKFGLDAMLLMARHHIQHLPVKDGNTIVGIVTTKDLIRYQSHNTVYITIEIHHCNSIDEIKALCEQLPKALVTLVQSSMTAYDIGHMISSIGEATTVRLLALAEEKLGKPPVPYAWIVAGSLSRDEQTACSDQDNALILSDDYNKQAHGEYFKKLSQFVCDGLNTCGYTYCPGDVMATNEKWRQPLFVWRQTFESWINSPEPKALMYTSIFFDLRCVYGDAAMLEKLQKEILKKTKRNSIFLAHLAVNALQHHPPLGFFRTFVLEKGGSEEKALNMKKRGIIPVTDLARVYALSAGINALNTQDRLIAASEAGALSKVGMADLRDAFEFIGTVRLQHQALQIKRGEKPDNFVPPEQLSSLESRHLKDAFEVVRTFQEAMENRFHAGRI